MDYLKSDKLIIQHVQKKVMKDGSLRLNYTFILKVLQTLPYYAFFVSKLFDWFSYKCDNLSRLGVMGYLHVLFKTNYIIFKQTNWGQQEENNNSQIFLS